MQGVKPVHSIDSIWTSCSMLMSTEVLHVCPDDVNATFLLHGQLILQNFVLEERHQGSGCWYQWCTLQLPSSNGQVLPSGDTWIVLAHCCNKPWPLKLGSLSRGFPCQTCSEFILWSWEDIVHIATTALCYNVAVLVRWGSRSTYNAVLVCKGKVEQSWLNTRQVKAVRKSMDLFVQMMSLLRISHMHSSNTWSYDGTSGQCQAPVPSACIVAQSPHGCHDSCTLHVSAMKFQKTQHCPPMGNASCLLQLPDWCLIGAGHGFQPFLCTYHEQENIHHG